MKKYLASCMIALFAAFIWATPQVYPAEPCFTTLTMTPATLNFAPREVGTTSAPQTVTLTNTGGCTIYDLATAFGGPGADDYLGNSDTCDATLAPDESCTVDIQFNPQAVRDYTATFEISSSSISSPVITALTVNADNTGTIALLLSLANGDDESGCNADASTGVAGKKSFGSAALGLVALMGLVLGTAAVRRRMRKRG